MVTMFNFLRQYRSVFHSDSAFPLTVYESSNPSVSSLALVTICLFDYSHPTGCEVVSHCGFDLHFPDDNGLLILMLFVAWLSIGEHKR